MDGGSPIIRLALALVTLAALALPATASAEFGVQLRFETVAPEGTAADWTPPDIAPGPDGSVFVLWGQIVQHYDASGRLVASWDNGAVGSDAIAADAAGHVYVLQSWPGQIVKFTAAGAHVATFTAVRRVDQLGIDAAGNLYVVEDPADIKGQIRPTTTLHKLSPAGEILASRDWPTGTMAVSSAGTLFQPGRGDRIRRFDPIAAFRMLPGEKPGGRGSKEGSCCGLAILGDQVWVARSVLGLIEGYRPDGRLARACPVDGLVTEVEAGSDGRLFVLEDRSIVRYGETATPCDTQRPEVTSLWMPKRVIDQSSRRRLRRAGVFFSTSEQGTARITLTRIAKGRRVVEARSSRITAWVTDPSGQRLHRLLRRKRLPAGRYEISVVVTDRAGLRSKPRVIRARVIR